MSIWGKSLKIDLLKLVEELGILVDASATVIEIKRSIEAMDNYAEEADFIRDLLVTIRETRIEENRVALEQAERKLEREQEERKLEREQEERRLEREEKMELEKARLDHDLQLAKVRVSMGELNSTLSCPSVENKRKFTLPKLEFRQFGDDLKDWLPFWSQFKSIHEDDDIANEDKFQYLIQATVKGSRAREVVESFPPTGENYEKAIDSLKSRFGKDELLVEMYVRELLKLILSAQVKDKVCLTSLYDKLESHLRNLETLKVTTDKCAAILYPMVESCFPVQFLKAWNRSNAASSSTDSQERLKKLMDFLRTEVEGEERINLAVAGFGLNKEVEARSYKKKNYAPDYLRNRVPTAANLFTSTTQGVDRMCIFCSGRHKSSGCFYAQRMTLSERQQIAKGKGCCFACLQQGHLAKTCRSALRCVVCSRKHVPLMCDRIEPMNKISPKKEEIENGPVEKGVSLSNHNKTSTRVFLQTLKAKLLSAGKQKVVRLLLDSGSHKSFISKNVAREMKCSPLRQEKLIHSLFGGVSTEEVTHDCYRILLKNLDDAFTCNFEVLGQDRICENIRPVSQGPWIKELEAENVQLSDISDSCEPVDILIGADIMGKLLTGKRKILSSGLVALETLLGWTLMGKAGEESSSESLATAVTSLFVKEADVSSLWRLDLIGITDPIEKKSKHEVDLQTREHFLETVRVNEGRYEVCLPWADDKTPLPDNLSLAKKRLDYTTSKVLDQGLYKEYDNVFLGWLEEGIIEEVPPSEVLKYGNYLPHRPVIKPSSKTTPIRPVFDASARLAHHPSLNQCLQCGPNMIELIPDVLLRFRKGEYGVVGDIRKAFCQISIRQEDRDFLRFLWWENLEQKKLKYFRHSRVVFGVKSSPFLLASVIEYHIQRSNCYDCEFREKLAQSFYVDNVVTSVDSKEELESFIHNAKDLMYQGGFELREWEYSGHFSGCNDQAKTHVLGLIWNKELDTLKIEMNWIDDINFENVTKRSILSTVHRVFDPFGFVSPVMLCPKIMLQSAWKKGIGWDEEVDDELRKEFLQWCQDLKLLEHIEIPRCIQVTGENMDSCAIHTFVDGSQDAYAATIFLRIEKGDRIEVFLLAARSRVTPLRGVTIPRVELLAAVIGTRLTHSVVTALKLEKIEKHYWSDSTTVLAWIMREDNWSVFVRNRVQEIRKLSDPTSWRHVPGEKNPADLPSRGCKAKQLLSSRWWEGPQWMKDRCEFYQLMGMSEHEWNEEEITKEKSRSACVLANGDVTDDRNWYVRRFSRYDSIIRLVAWILRFMFNCRKVPGKRKAGEISSEEFQQAEKKLIGMVQRDFLHKSKSITTIDVFKDHEGIIRVKTRITERDDNPNFLAPVFLPNCVLTRRLIEKLHLENCHAGTQILLGIIREHYWILKARKEAKSVVRNCMKCKRYSSRFVENVPVTLPKQRVKDARVFQFTGVDLAGPLFLRNGDKVWIVLFTCAVYRAVHLELVTALSTEAFLQCLRRFIARRGRPSEIYSDNGTNFTGSAHILDDIRFVKEVTVNRITWKFNPPAAPWWGGFWERLVRTLKELLRRTLGKANLSYEELLTVICDCESVINSRPLTYISENCDLLTPLTPSMFLRENVLANVTDIDHAESKDLQRRIRYREKLFEDLRMRFRREYLGQLVMKPCQGKNYRDVQVGEVVLIGGDNLKRIHWPLARIVEVFPGRDGKVRAVKLRTQNGLLVRPIRRIYPLEVDSSNVDLKCLGEEIPDVSSVPLQYPSIDRLQSNDRATVPEVDVSFPADHPLETVEPLKRSRYGRELRPPERL